VTAPQTVTSGAAVMTWEPGSRLATIHFERAVRVTGVDGRALVGSLTGWIGTEGRLFGLLGDGGNLSGLDADYRSVWAAFFRQHRNDSRIAFFNMNPFVRIAAEMFRIGTGLQIKAFADERSARSWLRNEGIAA
jgi:hypothetical protein